MIPLKRAELTIRRQLEDSVLRLSGDFESSSARASFGDAAASGFIESLELADGVQVVHIDLHLQQAVFDANNNLALHSPLTVNLHTDTAPEAITAFYLFKDWWTRPAFIRSWAEIPTRTQVALLKLGNACGCLVPMVGSEFKTVLGPGGPDWMSLSLFAGRPGQSGVFEPLFCYAEAPTAREAIHKAFSFVAAEKNVPLRPDRPLPEFFEYLGWCSWDACYRDLTEKVVLDKAAELRDKQVPVRWMLMDDGWQTVENDSMVDFIPDTTKFPRGFADMIREIKKDGCVDWFGVWHALAGYWGGVAPDGYLAKSQKHNLLKAVSGRLLPGPQAAQAYAFYADWHRYLREEGIDFVKVDVQGAVPNHYANSASLCEAARGLLEGLDAGSVCMNDAVINCMGMPMENIVARPASAVARNSDDFFPGQPESFREHLLQNAYNALYHGELYVCDWDMFWTDHPDAARHALLRAVSGGPVYCSDKVGRTVPAVLAPLSYLDGRILRMREPGRATEDCVFTDPFREGVLKIANTAAYGGTVGGGIAAYNLTASEQTCSFQPEDIPGLPTTAQYVIYDWFDRTAQMVAAGQTVSKPLPAQGFAWFQVLPYSGAAALLGRTDKYVGFMALLSQGASDAGVTGAVREQGPIAVVSSRRIEHAVCNGEGVSGLLQQTEAGGLYLCTLDLPVQSGEAVIELHW